MALSASLLECAARGDANQLTRLIKAKSCNVNASDESGCSALQRAAADGHVEVVTLLLEHGADVNKQDAIHGNTALHEAAWKGYSRCVALLCSRTGCELSICNAGGFAPLHLSCQNGHNQSCRELLIAGADPDQQNNYGDTSLHTAARYGHAGVTRILISANCRVSEQNKNGDTALHIAAAMGRRKLTRILLEAGCDKALKNQQGETARDIAQRKGLEEIICILNTPVAKQKKKEKKRDKSRERALDETDAPKKKDKGKKKKNVHFDLKPPAQWSPYGCHHYPDPKYFPKPKLNSLPTEPLKKGEQYYLDLAGNIKKGPIGPGYTCYCAPFFKHMENKMNEDKKDLKQHIDRAHERLDQKVIDLEIKTQGQISQLTRFVAAERALCKERHEHLERWLTRGMLCRASERVKKLDYSPKGSLDIPPLKRTRSLELIESNTDDWRRVRKIIKAFNKDAEQYECNAKDLNDLSKETSKSTELLDRGTSVSPKRYALKSSKSSDQLDSPRRSVTTPLDNQYNVTAEVHVKSNRVSVSQSPVSMEGCYDRLRSSSRNTKSPSESNRQGSRGSNYESDHRSAQTEAPRWKSQVLQRTADDIRKRVLLEKELADITRATEGLDISQDGYVKIKHAQENIECEPRRSVQEIIAQVEKQTCRSSEPTQRYTPTEFAEHMPQQPSRPAPILKEKPPKTKRFSLHNLIPFPTRKTFQSKDTGNNSESSDEEDVPIRTINRPGPMKNANLLQTLPLPNYETVSDKSPSPAPQIPHRSDPLMKPYAPIDLRSMVPKDAYFHDIPNRPFNPSFNETGLPTSGRNRTPLYNPNGIFDAMMQDHIMREMERVPRRYGDLNEDTELEITNERDTFRDEYRNHLSDNLRGGQGMRPPLPDHNLLQSRLESLAINTQLPVQHMDRESHNDSGYSTKVYGSSQGPSPSLSGHVDDNLSGRVVLNGKPLSGMGASSLV